MTFDIIHIPHAEEGIRKYVEQYKNFRLLMLKTAPEAFGASHADAVKYTDEIWYNRLANPKANIFLALRGETVVSSLMTMGPLRWGPEE